MFWLHADGDVGVPRLLVHLSAEPYPASPALDLDLDLDLKMFPLRAGCQIIRQTVKRTRTKIPCLPKNLGGQGQVKGQGQGGPWIALGNRLPLKFLTGSMSWLRADGDVGVPRLLVHFSSIPLPKEDYISSGNFTEGSSQFGIGSISASRPSFKLLRKTESPDQPPSYTVRACKYARCNHI